MLKDWWEALVDLVFPPRCPACRSSVERHGRFCPACLSGVLLEREINTLGRGLTALDTCRVLCNYSGCIRLVIHDIKFHRSTRYAFHLHRLLTEKIDAGRFSRIDAVVPVPLHSSRLSERGFNQTELIFRKWAQEQGWLWLDCLARIRPTAPQWELDLAARRKNIKSAFIVTRPDLVQEKTILLVDDILTSGLTLNECAKVLKLSGAKNVAGFALASGGG